MSLEHDITYKWAYSGASLSATRAIIGSVAGSLDVQVPTATYASPQTFSLTVAKALSVFLLSDQPVTLKAGGVNATQTITVTGTPTGGSFTLTFGGQTTAAIAFNATATAVQTALNLLSSIGTGGVTCGGGPFPGTPVTVTFGGLNAVQVVALMTHTDSFTGGSTPAASVATTTAGVAANTTISLVAGVPLVWDSAGYFTQPFAADVATLRITNTSGAGANVRLRTLSNA